MAKSAPPRVNRQPLDSSFLSDRGLNLQAALELEQLPDTLTSGLGPDYFDWKQLILVGHGGRAFWQRLNLNGMRGDHPIDRFTLDTLAEWFAHYLPNNRYRVVYPGSHPANLQALGQCLGWHHPSPFRVGINARWGSWFAYRALLLTDTDFVPTPMVSTPAPCAQCTRPSCLENCPADALSQGDLLLDRCLEYRQRTGSQCAERCLARNACPEGSAHRYSEQQTRYHYRQSLIMLRKSR